MNGRKNNKLWQGVANYAMSKLSAFQRASLRYPGGGLVDFLTGGTASKSGITVSEDNAMRASAVYACVKVLSETVAMLPLILYRRGADGGKIRAVEHPYYELMHDAPNRLMSSMDFREAGMVNLCLRGNFYARIETNNGGRITSLWPLRADRMAVKVEDNVLAYEYTPDGAEKTVYPAAQILHVRGLGGDGLTGLSPIAQARDSIGLAMAAEEHGSRLYANGALISTVFKHPGRLSEAAHKHLLGSVEERYSGVSNAHKSILLEEGMDVSRISMTAEDAQLLEAREFQVVDICRIYRVPPHKIGDLRRATFSNIEHQSIEFVTDTILPWAARWEQRLNRSLLTETERRRGYFFEHLLDGIQRGDIGTRYAAYTKGINAGFLTRNEVRKMENLNPVDGADNLLEPLNMKPLGENEKKNENT